MGVVNHRTSVLQWPPQDSARKAKQDGPVRRLLAMHAPIRIDRPIRPVATTALRTALALMAALLLILVVLPAALAAQAATI
jgi:hypothetical protein